ncbi:trans-sialidase [Trypanosoma theileri]|uniref:Trans-sialidase n=1 Tax=Trypanosoma theileri TaxID=67003 RepID=A0A1X0NNB9_9TRYP|nr:trans-sialidase [Trypanosoma theileri]ORC86222.1 trans-sialidase [Trypanosoma theileri]
MPHSLFVVLLILLLGCISGYAQEEGPQEETVPIVDSIPSELFKSINMSQPTRSGNNVQLEAVHQFHAPHLFFFNGYLVSITAAAVYQDRDTKQNEFIKLLKKNKTVESETVLKWNESNGYVFHYTQAEKSVKDVFDNDKKDYQAVLALVESSNPPSQEGSVLRIVWMKRGKSEPSVYSVVYDRHVGSSVLPRGDSTVLRFLVDTSTSILTMKNNASVFPVQFVTNDNKTISTVMYRRPDEQQWKIGGALPHMDTYNPAILELEDGKLVMIAHHTSGYYRVYESTDLGKTWTESTSTLSRVWSTSTVATNIPITERGSQNNFITATIGEKRVILFLQSVETEEENELHLWVTDKTHINRVGMIVKDKKVKSSTLLFKDDKLYCLYESSKEEGKYTVLFVDLTNKVNKIKEVLNTWDTIASKGICCTDEACTSFDCRISTTKLVGYLSGTIDEESNWKDEYLGVDASVSGTVKKNPNGFTFMGIGAGAMWPVSINEMARQYHFTNYAFTLVATVAIHAAPKKGSSPLLGVSLLGAGHSILLGLSYNKNKTWNTIHRNVVQASDIRWEVDRTYTVVLTFANSDCSVQIDGDPMGFVEHNFNRETEEISHFYFGSDGEAGDSTFATVTNIMLYNSVLTQTEIDALIKKKLVISLSESVKQMLSEEIKMQSTLPTPATSSTAGPHSMKKPQNTNSGNQGNATNRKQGSDGTVSIYASVLPMLVLGLWALATVFP